MKGPGVEINVDIENSIRELASGIHGLSGQVEKAIARAIRKTMLWLSRQVIRQLAQELSMPARSLKGRVVSKVNVKERFGQVWIGLNPIGAHLVGKPKGGGLLDDGVFVGEYYFPGAFVATIYGDGPRVWRRKYRGAGSTAKGRSGLDRSERRWARKDVKGGGNYSAHSKYGRFPVELMTVDIADRGAEAAYRIREAAARRFHTLLEQELNYAVNHEKS